MARCSKFRIYTFDLKPTKIIKREPTDVSQWFDAGSKNLFDGSIYDKLKKVVVEGYGMFFDDDDILFFEDKIIADIKDDISNDIIRILNQFSRKFNCEFEGDFMMLTHKGEWIFKAPKFDKEERPYVFDLKQSKINSLKNYFYIGGDSPSYLYYYYCKGEINGLPKVVIKWKPGPLGKNEFFKILTSEQFEMLKADVIDTVDCF